MKAEAAGMKAGVVVRPEGMPEEEGCWETVMARVQGREWDWILVRPTAERLARQ